MQFPLPFQDKLPQFRVVGYADGGVFLVYLLQGLSQLLILLLVFGHHRHPYLRYRERDRVDTALGPLAVERMTGIGIFQLQGTADIAYPEFIYRVAFLAIGNKELA